jgi:hypothetical protein
MKKWLEYSVSNYFLMEKGVNSVHGPWTAAPVGSPWTKDMAMVGSSPELLFLADSGHGARHELGKTKRVLRGFSFAYYRGLGGGEEVMHQWQCFGLEWQWCGCSRG